MEQFCIITNRSKDEALSTAEWIVNYLTSFNKKVTVANVTKDSNGQFFTEPHMISPSTDCVIVLGGDGTLLRAAHDLKELKIPLFGINLGTLGFLTETEHQNIKTAFDNLFQNKYIIESRMMLSLTVHNNGNEYPEYSCALNDIVITRSGFSRLINIHVYVNGKYVNEYRGDGVIISTPTGSTGYNLSAGGPVVIPKTELMIITPICPHSLNTRSIVVSSDDTVSVKICTSKKTQNEEAIVTVDGNDSIHLKAEDYIEINKSSYRTKLIKFDDKNFFDILRKKLGA